jgi:hypothetical protein
MDAPVLRRIVILAYFITSAAIVFDDTTVGRRADRGVVHSRSAGCILGADHRRAGILAVLVARRRAAGPSASTTPRSRRRPENGLFRHRQNLMTLFLGSRVLDRALHFARWTRTARRHWKPG